MQNVRPTWRPHFITMDKREQIAELLEQHNLTLHYEEIFSRWLLDVKDADGNVVWHRKGMDLVRMRDELLEYLHNL